MITYRYKKDIVVLTPRKDRPQEVDTSFLNEDGLKRNLYKFRVEWVWSKAKAKESPAGHGWIFTAMLNNFVERLRHAPYTWGHLLPVAGIALIALALV